LAVGFDDQDVVPVEPAVQLSKTVPTALHLDAEIAVGLTFFGDACRAASQLSFSDCLFFLTFLDFLNGITLVKGLRLP
jgi:hypothetical protein